MSIQNIQEETIILSDYIYSIVELSNISYQIIQHPFFQRLKQINQLGSIHFKNKNADHKRYEHSIGVAYLSRIAVNNLSEKININCIDNLSVEPNFLYLLKNIIQSYQYYQNSELENNINTGMEYNIHFDLIEYVLEWCNATNIEECKIIIQKMITEKEIFLGEFVKALLKINNISIELEKVAELIGNMDLLSKLREIPIMTLKYVVTNQSLYV
jgi:hypothetical protein